MPVGPKLKPLHWRKLGPTSVSQESLWACLLRTAGGAQPSASELNEIVKLFAHKEPTKKLLVSREPSPNGGPKATPPPEFLSAKRAQNIAICLTKVAGMAYESMASCVSALNPTCVLHGIPTRNSPRPRRAPRGAPRGAPPPHGGTWTGLPLP